MVFSVVCLLFFISPTQNKPLMWLMIKNGHISVAGVYVYIVVLYYVF